LLVLQNNNNNNSKNTSQNENKILEEMNEKLEYLVQMTKTRNAWERGSDSKPAAIQGFPSAAAESKETSQKPNMPAVESVPGAHPVSATRRLAYNRGSVAPPHRSNRISQSKVDNTGLQQNYRR
jgi:hypothetical protein